jgi:hypothetical protein
MSFVMGFNGQLAPAEGQELSPVSLVFMPKEKTPMSKSFAISLGPACQNCWDVEQSAS